MIPPIEIPKAYTPTQDNPPPIRRNLPNARNISPLQEEATVQVHGVALRVFSPQDVRNPSPETLERDVLSMTVVLLDAVKTVNPETEITEELKTQMSEIARRHILAHMREDLSIESLVSPK